MTLARIQKATVEVKDYAALKDVWRLHGDWLVGRYVVKDRLNTSQLKRLPKVLKRILIHGKAASGYQREQKDIAELERMFRLEDPRA